MSKKILIVDDSPLIHTLLKKCLENNGHQVIGDAKNGKEGMEMYSSLKPEVTFMDINMPIMDGLESARNIKQMDNEAKIIMLTAVGDEETIKRANDMGVKIFLRKPFDDYKIISALSKL